jgi:hypothetical protein
MVLMENTSNETLFMSNGLRSKMGAPFWDRQISLGRKRASHKTTAQRRIEMADIR